MTIPEIMTGGSMSMTMLIRNSSGCSVGLFRIMVTGLKLLLDWDGLQHRSASVAASIRPANSHGYQSAGVLRLCVARDIYRNGGLATIQYSGVTDDARRTRTPADPGTARCLRVLFHGFWNYFIQQFYPALTMTTSAGEMRLGEFGWFVAVFCVALALVFWHFRSGCRNCRRRGSKMAVQKKRGLPSGSRKTQRIRLWQCMLAEPCPEPGEEIFFP